MSTAEDELLKDLARGDRIAFRAIYDTHVRATYGAAFRITRQYEDAEEATQEAFIQLAALGAEAVKIRSVRSWLQQVATRRAIDLIRRRRRSSPAAEVVDDGEAAVVGMETLMPSTTVGHDRLVQNNMMERIRVLIDQLPERQAMAFRHRHFQGMSVAEVAEAMGCSAGAVKAHLHLGVVRMRQLLEADGALDKRREVSS